MNSCPLNLLVSVGLLSWCADPTSGDTAAVYSQWDSTGIKEVVEDLSEYEYRGLVMLGPAVSDLTRLPGLFPGPKWLPESRGAKVQQWCRSSETPLAATEVIAAQRQLNALLIATFVPKGLPEFSRGVHDVHLVGSQPGSHGILTSVRATFPDSRIRYCRVYAEFTGSGLSSIHGFVSGWDPAQMRSAAQVLGAIGEVLIPQRSEYEMTPPMDIEGLCHVAKSLGVSMSREQISADYPRTYRFSVVARNLWVHAGRTILKSEKSGEREVGAIAFRWFKTKPIPGQSP